MPMMITWGSRQNGPKLFLLKSTYLIKKVMDALLYVSSGRVCYKNMSPVQIISISARYIPPYSSTP